MTAAPIVTETAASATPARWVGWLWRFVLLAHGTLVWLLILRPPIVFPGVDVDPSWKQLVGMDFHERIQAGVDFVFTYGPLGYFLAAYPSYVPEVFWHRVVFEMVLKAGVVLAVLAPVLRIPRIWQRLVYLAVVIAVGPIADDAFVLMAVTAGTAALVLHGARFALVLPFTAFVAMLGMGKFVYFLVGGGCVGLLALATWRHRGLRHALAVPFAFAASLLIAWMLVGQSVANLPAFVKGSMEISSGYNESMRWVPIDGKRWYFGDVLLALATIALAGASTLFTCLGRPWQLRRWLAAAAIFAVLFMSWKSGFVRQDAGHTMIFFCCAAVVPMWVWSLGEVARRRWLVNVAVLAAVAMGFVGAFRLETDYRLDTVGILVRHHAVTNGAFVADPAAARARLEDERRQLEREHQLPEIKKVVGAAPTDEVPHHQSILFLNGLSIRHRPIFQSYSAYTPYLQRLNGDFYVDSRRGPQFVLFKLDAIDAQYATVADSQIYSALLRNFRPRLFERGYLLLERSAEAAAVPASRRVAQEGTAALSQWVELPPSAELGELAVDLPFSLLGSLWSFAIRGPRLFLDVRLASGQVIENFVVSRGSMQLPFLLDPLLDTRGFAKLWFGVGNVPRVTAFRIRARGGQERLYRSQLNYTFWRCDLPPQLDPAIAREMRIDAPMFDRAPHAEEPVENFTVHRDGEGLVRLAQPPSAMTFEGLEGRVVTTGVFGLLPASWEGDAATDGVTFRIERIDADGTVHELFARPLDPKRVEGDRGRQGFVVETTLGRGAKLVFRTVSADTRWDWSYWTDLQFADAAILAKRTLSVDTMQLDRAAGGPQRFTLDAGAAFANRPYRLLGTTAGTAPGQSFAGAQVPLAPSTYFGVTSGDVQESAVFAGFRGTLDAAGRATATLQLPAGSSGVDGRVLHHVFVVLDDEGRGLFVSNVVPLFLR